jgi:hypothetical protein
MIPLGVSVPPGGLQTIVFTGIAVWDLKSSALDSDGKFASSRPFKQISHDCQTVRSSNTPSVTILIQSSGQMVDHSQSTMDTKSRCLPTFHDRQYESLPKHILCEGRPAGKTLGQFKVDPRS